MRPIEELTGLTIESFQMLAEERDERDRLGIEDEVKILDNEIDRLTLHQDQLPLPTTFEGDDVDVWLNGMEYGMKWAAMKGAIGKREKSWKSRFFCCVHAFKIWKENPDTPIPDVLERLMTMMLDAHDATMQAPERMSTIRTWLDEAEKSGVIVIPPALKTRKR